MTLALVEHEMAAFAKGEGTWHNLYAFLSAVDMRLSDDLVGYRSGGWSKSQSQGWPYYGYRFAIGDAPIMNNWIGFEAPKNAPARLALYHGKNASVLTLPMTPDDLAKVVSTR
jgi:hypothetical protein